MALDPHGPGLDPGAAEMHAQIIDFSAEGLPEYKDLYAVLLSGVLNRAECNALIAKAEATTGGVYEQAMINIGNGQQALSTDTRNCGRIIWDSQVVVDGIFSRLKDVPEVASIMRLENVPRITGLGPTKRGEVWSFTRPNDRMRFLKYGGGEYFRVHQDGSYQTPDGRERSYYTLHLYLNDAGPPDEEHLRTLSSKERLTAAKRYLIGGETSFHDAQRLEPVFNVECKAGSVLIFQHRNLLHSGAEVLQGTKYTMRTDLMYAREPQPVHS